METDFVCGNCHKKVFITKEMGTKNRNHCPFCLWSKHVDENVSGDRNSMCEGLMEPVGLTFKQEGFDKSGKKRQGELMLVHQCQKCQKYVINRIAGDDNEEQILKVYQGSISITKEIKVNLVAQNILLLDLDDEKEIKTQLYGKKFV